jgi:hypothetical protein
MILSPPIPNRYSARYSCCLSASSAHARIPLVHPYTHTHASRPRDRVDHFDPISSSPTPRPNPHSARCTATAPLSAISCLGAFRTPAARARG